MGQSGKTLLMIAAGVAFVGCGGEGGVGPEAGAPRLTVVSGADVTDSVDAVLSANLVVELKNSRGSAMAGIGISFDGAFQIASTSPLVEVGRVDAGSFGSRVVVNTDSRGRAAARVKLGQASGQVQVRVFVLNDTTTATSAAYRVNPGNPVRVQLSPRDTAIYAGRSFSLRATSTDRYGNAGTSSMEYSSDGRVTSVEASGLVTAHEIGRSVVRLRAGTTRDSAFVSVPPVGTVVALVDRLSTSDPMQYISMGLDGSDRKVFVTVDGFAEADLGFSPDGSEAVFAAGSHTTALFRLSNGASSPFPLIPMPLASLAFPRYSHDGNWVYFSGRPGFMNGEIWRVNAAGTFAERAGEAADEYALDATPDPSPDGTRVVYSTNRVNITMPTLRIFNEVTRTVTATNVAGVTPRWSPDGQSIVYVTAIPQWGYLEHNRLMRSPGQLATISANGTNPRIVPTGTIQWQPHIDISPDGRYVLAAANAGLLYVIELSTGALMPIPGTTRFVMPNWKP